ncbi:MAG TPA: hypothetical protein VJN71_01060 [Nitrososphaerales archaeon]|nr:hypothetical protein [Nitrososphaerales archaeon]
MLDSSSPAGDGIAILSANQFSLGFNVPNGQHYSGGYQLWTTGGSGGLEYFPPDKC